MHQRGTDGYHIGSDAVSRAAYGPIPDATEFWHGIVPITPILVHGWMFSQDWGTWRALVTMPDGWHGWTSPKTR